MSLFFNESQDLCETLQLSNTEWVYQAPFMGPMGRKREVSPPKPNKYLRLVWLAGVLFNLLLGLLVYHSTFRWLPSVYLFFSAVLIMLSQCDAVDVNIL